MAIKHLFSSPVVDELVADEVGPGEWNAAHVIDPATISAGHLDFTPPNQTSIDALSNALSVLEVRVSTLSAIPPGTASVTSQELSVAAAALSIRIDTQSQAVSVLSQALSALSQATSVADAALSVRVDTQSQGISVLSQQVSALSQALSVLSQATSVADAALSNKISVTSAAVTSVDGRVNSLSAVFASLSVLSVGGISTHGFQSILNALSNRISIASGGTASVTSQELSVAAAALSVRIDTQSQNVSLLSQKLSAVSCVSATGVGFANGLQSVINALSNRISAVAGGVAPVYSVFDTSVGLTVKGGQTVIDSLSANIALLSLDTTIRLNIVSNAVSGVSQRLSVLSQAQSVANAALSVRIDTQSQSISVLSQALSLLSQAVSVANAALSVRIDTQSNSISVLSQALSALSQATSVAQAALSVRIDTQSQSISVLSNALSALSQATSVADAALSVRIDTQSQSISVVSQALSVAAAALSNLTSAHNALSNVISALGFSIVSQPATKVLVAIASVIGTALTDVSGLSVSVSAGAVYEIVSRCRVIRNISTQVYGFGMAFPAMAKTFGVVDFFLSDVQSAAAATGLYRRSWDGDSANGSILLSLTAAGGTLTGVLVFEGVMKCSTTGTVRIQARTSAAANAMAFDIGSFLRIKKL